MAAAPAALIWAYYAIVIAATAYSVYKSYTQEEPSLTGEDYGANLRQNTRSTEENIRIIYGTVKVGGNDVFIETTGSHNKSLWIAQCLGEGECDSLYQEAGVDQAFLDDDLYTLKGGNVTYWFHRGTSTQTADANLNAATGGKWTDCLKNTCYIVWRIRYDSDYFRSVPKRLVVVKGRKLYDYRTSTTAFSANPALVLYDYMTNSRYGLGFSDSKFDSASWLAAANYCDAKGWEYNGVITGNKNADDVINQILFHFRGTLVWYDGKFYLRYSDLNDESTVMNLTDSHIAQDQNGKAAISIKQNPRLQRPDSIRVAYTEPDKDYVTDHIMIGNDSGVVNNITLPGCTNREMASNLGVYELERSQLDRAISGTFRDDCLKLEPHDLVSFTSSALGISGQTMRVSDMQIQPDGLISLTLLYESLALYDDSYNLDAEDTYTCSLPDINEEPPSVGNVVLTEETYSYRLRTFTRLNVAFTISADYPWLKHIEVWISFNNADWEHLFNVTDNFFIDPVQEGATYYIKFITVSIWDTKQSDESAYKASKLIAGDNAAPDSLAALSAIANQNSVLLYADKLSDDDIDTYEFRLGDSWSGAIFLASMNKPNLSLSGVKPGVHTFWVNTLSNNGIYGETPRSASVTLIDPPDGWTVADTETDDYL